jgi:catechol 2,3-dioxygenase-like lactoylglutathione lyase family enzyme
MSGSVIDRVGHLAIRVRDLDAAVHCATHLMGMREVERRDGCVYLTLGAEHHTLQYLAADEDELDHLGLEAAGPAALATIRERVDEEGLAVVSETPLDDGIAEGFAFVGPDDVVYEIYTGMDRGQPAYHPTGVRPARLGHFTMHPRDPEAVRSFLERVLGFRLSDTIAGDGYFLRCNAEHHGIGLFRGVGKLHHHGWAVQSLTDLGRLGDLLDEQGSRLIWGPLRHGAGNNIAAYFVEPAGSVVEYYTDMEHIYDEGTFRPRTWDSADSRWYSRWSAGRPQGFRDFGLTPRAIPQTRNDPS